MNGIINSMGILQIIKKPVNQIKIIIYKCTRNNLHNIISI